jgi:hypothetical protein
MKRMFILVLVFMFTLPFIVQSQIVNTDPKPSYQFYKGIWEKNKEVGLFLADQAFERSCE